MNRESVFAGRLAEVAVAFAEAPAEAGAISDGTRSTGADEGASPGQAWASRARSSNGSRADWCRTVRARRGLRPRAPATGETPNQGTDRFQDAIFMRGFSFTF